MRSIATQPGSTHSGRSELLRGCFCLPVFADVASRGRNARGLHSKQAKLKINCERFQSRECHDSHLIPIVLAIWKLISYHHSWGHRTSLRSSRVLCSCSCSIAREIGISLHSRSYCSLTAMCCCANCLFARSSFYYHHDHFGCAKATGLTTRNSL